MTDPSMDLGARIAAAARMAVELHLAQGTARTAARDEQQQQLAGGTGDRVGGAAPGRAGGTGTGAGGAGTRTLGYDDAPPCPIDLQAAKLRRLVREVAA